MLATSCVLVATGCGTSANQADDKGHRFQNAEITTDNAQPSAPLIPGNTNEWAGGRLINLLFTGLISYDFENMTPYNAVAESITTTDSKVFTIKIRKGWKFHDGTEVKAHNFVNAWNYTAYGPNKQRNNSFLNKIEGYADLNPAVPSGQPAPRPKTDRMSGLEVIDDYEFKVTLSTPFSVFSTMLGYWAFYPLPDSFFQNPAAFGRRPVGNGPYQFVELVPGSHQKLTAFMDYSGSLKPKVKDLTYRQFPNADAVYTALKSGEVDFMETLPHKVIESGLHKTDLPGRYKDRTLLLMQYLTFPDYLPGYDNPDLRKAVSMAIDRKSIIERIGGTQEPADGLALPGVQGYVEGQCGEFCTYNPDKAREHLAKSGFKGPLQLNTFAESDTGTWLAMVCESITTALQIGCEDKNDLKRQDFRMAVSQKKMTGAYRTDWRVDYPSLENFLNPQFRTGASANESGFSSPRLDAALAAADEAPNADAAMALYQKAERVAIEEMPVVPLWPEWSMYGWSHEIKNVHLSIQSELNVFDVQVVEPR
ncbi:MAG: peptide ABC transporter substrate-binding protein [Pseudonocardiaceae bacterium]